jgi:hypothetical protein
LTKEERQAKWEAMCDCVADQMKVFTRPYVNILAGEIDLGTGTFIEKDGVQILTCEHVARLNPAAHYIDAAGSVQLHPGTWRTEPDPNKEVALAPVPETEWKRVSGRARPLSTSKFAPRYATVKDELFFFRGIAGENVNYVGNFGVDAIISGYCSQEKHGTGNSEILEILWKAGHATVTSGTDDTVRTRFRNDDPRGFSGSLVWNTRFVELGCDLSVWTPDKALVTGLLRRFDERTETLLVWRIEHLLQWL